MNLQNNSSTNNSEEKSSSREDSLVQYRKWTDNNNHENSTNNRQTPTLVSPFNIIANRTAHSEDESNTLRDGMNRSRMFAYAIGHFSNDLCASMWFIYQSYYYLNVLKLSNQVTGFALLSGQLADGIATPIIGILSDKYNMCWGKRNTFYIIGSIIVIPSFLCIYTAPIWTNDSCRNIWYITWPMIFNIGWACVQVSHMSVVNSLTYD